MTPSEWRLAIDSGDGRIDLCYIVGQNCGFETSPKPASYWGVYSINHEIIDQGARVHPTMKKHLKPWNGDIRHCPVVPLITQVALLGAEKANTLQKNTPQCFTCIMLKCNADLDHHHKS